MLHLLAAVVTPDLTWRGYTLEIDRQNRAQVIDKQTGEPVAEMDSAAFTTADGNTYRITGEIDGVPTVWRAVKLCARCATPMVYATPDYDIPT